MGNFYDHRYVLVICILRSMDINEKTRKFPSTRNEWDEKNEIQLNG